MSYDSIKHEGEYLATRSASTEKYLISIAVIFATAFIASYLF